MRRPEVCVGAVAVHDDALLMVQRGAEPDAGAWTLPGGRIEPRETAAQAVVRELAEETGLEGVCGPLLGWVERIGDEHHFVILDFEVSVLDPSGPRAGSDAVAVEWVPLPDVVERRLADGLAEFLADHRIIRTLT